MSIQLSLAQINLTVGDFTGNVTRILRAAQDAHQAGSRLIVFPELTVCGYSPQDLMLEASFVAANLEAIDKVAAAFPRGLTGVVGFIDPVDSKRMNAAAIIQDGRVIAKRYKTLLPNYDVFDEKRYFKPATTNTPVELRIGEQTFRLGVEICEDLWDGAETVKITDHLAEQGCDLIVNLSASPYIVGKREQRIRLIRDKVLKTGVPFALVNLIGGQDELIFDGNSVALSAAGELIAHAGAFEESTVTCEVGTAAGQPVIDLPTEDRAGNIQTALVLGIRDYFRKSGFQKAVLGLSGGIDSALVACLAAEALGTENVSCLYMPSRYSADISGTDARRLAENLGVQYLEIPIDRITAAYDTSLHDLFQDREEDVTEENIQSRVRGNLLMAYANKFAALVLVTGNKTELALGYSTLYGDMSGALAVIGDVSKSDVYRLAKHYHELENNELIPMRILERAPSAELKAEQVDPFDYAVMSPLVDAILNERFSNQQLLEAGYTETDIREARSRIRVAEFKRRQAAPVLKITPKAFGAGRRFPINNHFRR